MAKRLFIVNKPGIYASVQDLGRYGYQQYGVPVSGAMDKLALQIANLLVGNERNKACLEITIGQTSLKAVENHFIAVTGANLDVKIDGKSAPIWKSFWIRKGQELTFKGPVKGVRAYLAVSGGLETPNILGSQSVYERGKMGTCLQKKDALFAQEESHFNPNNKGIGLSKPPNYEKEVVVRLIPSYHLEKFTEDSIHKFFKSPFTVDRGDRMGYQIKNHTPLTFKKNGDIISEAVTFGTIQVPSSGNPIILMADSQTTGGYAIIGTIIKADLWKVGQLPQGGTIHFKEITLNEAVEADREQERLLKQLQVAAKLRLKK